MSSSSSRPPLLRKTGAMRLADSLLLGECSTEDSSHETTSTFEYDDSASNRPPLLRMTGAMTLANNSLLLEDICTGESSHETTSTYEYDDSASSSVMAQGVQSKGILSHGSRFDDSLEEFCTLEKTRTFELAGGGNNNMLLRDPVCGSLAKYTGPVCATTGLPCGDGGRLEYQDGRYHEGSWEKGAWHGPGTLRTGRGDVYEGEFTNGYRHGEGELTFNDGRVFKGEFVGDKIYMGEMEYTDGLKYRGYFENEAWHGRGRLYYTDGRIFDGEFEDGGTGYHGRMKFPDGSWYLGEWSNDQMHGSGKHVNADGSMRHKGKWENGKPVIVDEREEEKKRLAGVWGAFGKVPV